MQELTNDDYSDIKLYCIFHISNKDLELHIPKKSTSNCMSDAPFAGVASLSFQFCELENKANSAPRYSEINEMVDTCVVLT